MVTCRLMLPWSQWKSSIQTVVWKTVVMRRRRRNKGISGCFLTKDLCVAVVSLVRSPDLFTLFFCLCLSSVSFCLPTFGWMLGFTWASFCYSANSGNIQCSYFSCLNFCAVLNWYFLHLWCILFAYYTATATCNLLPFM